MYQRTTALAAVDRCPEERGTLGIVSWAGLLLDDMLGCLARAMGPSGDEV
jgi:hypothetical protein